MGYQAACPKCGSDEWNQFSDLNGHHATYRECAICHHEWTPSEEAAEHYERTVR